VKSGQSLAMNDITLWEIHAGPVMIAATQLVINLDPLETRLEIKLPLQLQYSTR
jgi:hypothetical protein